MYRIALVCENGASTGIMVRKMQEAAQAEGIDAEIKAYPFGQMEDFIDIADAVLLGPQLAFKRDVAKQKYPQHAGKIGVIAAVDFGMMRGDKVLKEAIASIQK